MIFSKKEQLSSEIQEAPPLVGGEDVTLCPGFTNHAVAAIVRLIIYQGKVGSIASVLGPKENSINLSRLPPEYRVYIGYRSYYDASHRKKAGGPLEIELLIE